MKIILLINNEINNEIKYFIIVLSLQILYKLYQFSQ